MAASIRINFFFLLILILISVVVCLPKLRVKRSVAPESPANPVDPGGGHGTTATNKSLNGLYNPFEFMNPEHTVFYLISALYVVLFAFVKLGADKEFNYCLFVGYKNCDIRNFYSSGPCSSCYRVCANHRTRANNFLPESTFLVTLGIIPSLVMLAVGRSVIDVSLKPEVVFNMLLIPIIMSAAWVTDKLTFYRNIGTILWFAIFGTVVNAAIIMPLLFYGSKSRWGIFNKIDMDLVDSGMYAILICAVDPVAVLSVFEAIHVDKLVYNVVFGESLLNDGVAVVFYKAFVESRDIHNLRFFESVGLIFCFFMYAFTISIVLGAFLAFVISFVTRLFAHQQPMQFVVILALNYFAYVLGDTIKGSGIITLFFCVLIQRQYVMANLSYTSQVMINQLLTQLGLLAEGVIFILMGLTAFSSEGIIKNTDVGFSFFLIFICYSTRYLVIFTLGWIINFFRKEKLTYHRSLFIQAHGGLRGAIGFSLAYSLESNFPNRYYYQCATAIMVFFSVYVLGSTIKPFVKLCNIPLESHDHKTVFMSMQEKLMDRNKDCIKAILGSSSLRFKWELAYTRINNKYLKKWFMSRKALERNVSHSSLVKLYRDHSITEAQKIAGDHGSVMMKDMLDGEGDARIKMYKRTWSSFNSLPGTPRANGIYKFQDEFDSHFSIPDMSVIDQTMTRRDVDDQMTHHNRPEGVGRKVYKKPQSQQQPKHHRTANAHAEPVDHRSQPYMQPHRVLGLRNVPQKKFNVAPRTNKSVKFDDIELISPTSPPELNRKPVFNLGEDSGQPIVNLIDETGTQRALESDGGYGNKGYEHDNNGLVVVKSDRSRNPSVCDPYVGRANSGDSIFNTELPWQRQDESDQPPQRSNEPMIPGLASSQQQQHLSPTATSPSATRHRRLSGNNATSASASKHQEHGAPKSKSPTSDSETNQ